MFGPPSSPPPTLSGGQENELRSALLPAFGHESGRLTTSNTPTTFKPREFLKPKFSIYRDPEEHKIETGLLPTPIPTSEANLQHSSSPPSSPHHIEPEVRSKDSVRAEQSLPLRQLIVVRVPTSGAAVTIGRSSKSSNFAVKPSNRLASRVHAKLSFKAEQNILSIECLGWNGLVVYVPEDVHSLSSKKEYPVACGKTINIERIDGITMNIHGDKALVEIFNDQQTSELTEDESWSQATPEDILSSGAVAPSSPPAAKRIKLDNEIDKENQCVRANSTESNDNDRQPSKIPQSNTASIHIQEKEAEPVNLKQELVEASQTLAKPEKAPVNIGEMVTPAKEPLQKHKNTEEAEQAEISQHLEDPQQAEQAEPAEPAERLELAEQGDLAQEKAVSTENERDSSEQMQASSAFSSRASSVEPNSDRRHRKPAIAISDEQKEELMNIAANHIAFSRQSAVPFASVRKASSVFQSLPKSQVREIIRSIPCVGVIEGGIEDTTGRKAEDEYYYDLAKDDNEERRSVVQNSTKGHRSLRNCRKTPKQYFYRPLNLKKN